MTPRARLANRRNSEIIDTTFRGKSYAVTFARFPDGLIGEVFIDPARVRERRRRRQSRRWDRSFDRAPVWHAARRDALCGGAHRRRQACKPDRPRSRSSCRSEMMMLNLRSAARALDGDVINGNEILCPGPGHSREDRSLHVKLDPRSPDGFIVISFAGDDWQVCKDYVRSRFDLPDWKPGAASHNGTDFVSRARQSNKATNGHSGERAEKPFSDAFLICRAAMDTPRSSTPPLNIT